MTALALYGARVCSVLTLRTGHRVRGPRQRVARVYRHHLVLEDGTSWPLPLLGDTSVYPADGPVHLEIST